MALSLDRRKMLSSMGAFGALSILPGQSARAASGGDITGRLARYMAGVHQMPLPEDVIQAGKARILDTIGAIVSGARLKPGIAAAAYVRTLGGSPQAGVATTRLRTSAVNAALANAMFAHADETDDFEPVTKAHPGCSAVPSALAMADKNGGSGLDFIRSAVLGYDLGCRLLMALGPDHVRATHRSAEGVSSTFCALGAAAPLARLDETRMRFAISYAAQQVSGLWSWVDDEDHIEKAFDFAGMGARNGVMAVTMVESGLTGVSDALDTTHNLFAALSREPKPEEMVRELGNRFFITESAIKRFSVGYPNQSMLDALLHIRSENSISPEQVKSILVRLPTDAIGIVGSSAMADVNCAHLAAVAMLKGTVSFDDSHDQSLMHDPKVVNMRSKVEIKGDATLMDPIAPRGSIVEIELTDGKRLSSHTRFPPGTPENPLSAKDLEAKVRDLVGPVLGAARALKLISAVSSLEGLGDVRQMTSLLAG